MVKIEVSTLYAWKRHASPVKSIVRCGILCIQSGGQLHVGFVIFVIIFSAFLF